LWRASSLWSAVGGVYRSDDVRFGSLADICTAKGHVRFTPNSDIDCVFRHDSHRAFNARGADHLYFAVFPVPPRKLPIVAPAHIANSTLDNMADHNFQP
jgi:hypothetical protein